MPSLGFNGRNAWFRDCYAWGKKLQCLCTASVEEVIDGHYKDQTYKLGDDEEELKEKIMKFRQDELDHKDIAYDNGATKKGLFECFR